MLHLSTGVGVKAKKIRLLLLWVWLAAFPAHAEPDVGKALAPFDTLLLDGTMLKADELAGKAVLVVFWATWCPTCRKELPQLEQLYRRHKAKGFEILAVSIDAERLEVDEFWRDHRYTLPVAMRTDRHSAIFGATKTPPRFFLIDRQGTLRFKHQGEIAVDKLEVQLKPLL
jgi:thiol-disulfide isomerase/thioredoxin